MHSRESSEMLEDVLSGFAFYVQQPSQFSSIQ